MVRTQFLSSPDPTTTSPTTPLHSIHFGHSTATVPWPSYVAFLHACSAQLGSQQLKLKLKLKLQLLLVLVLVLLLVLVLALGLLCELRLKAPTWLLNKPKLLANSSSKARKNAKKGVY